MGQSSGTWLLGTHIFLDQLDPGIGWRVAFLLGPVLGLVIIVVRRHLPESPRWQVMHGREREAEETIDVIEREVERGGRQLPPVGDERAIELTPRRPGTRAEGAARPR